MWKGVYVAEIDGQLAGFIILDMKGALSAISRLSAFSLNGEVAAWARN